MIGYAALIAAWLIIGLGLHAIVERITHSSFVADFITFAYAIVTGLLFGITQRHRRQRTTS
jgi:hypothetical protein